MIGIRGSNCGQRHVSRGLVWILFFGLVLLSLGLTPLPAQEEKINEEYTAKIKEFTTEPFFMTQYVDHLPFSENVPTPLDILGRIAGAPDVLSYSHEVYKYMQALADASPRVNLYKIGKTEEGRDMILVVVSDEDLAQLLEEILKELKKVNLQLAILTDNYITNQEVE